MEKGSAPTVPRRRPPALVPLSVARLGGFTGLALLGALEWQRMVDSLDAGDALLWVLVAVLAAAGVLWADSRRRFRATLTLAAAFAGLLAAYASTGLSLALLKPRRVDELGAGLQQGSEALANVPMPYTGADPWPSATLALLGALLCVLAGLLAVWPRERGRGYPFLSLALLLVMVASPVVSLDETGSVVLGLALTALTVGFLWLERLSLKPGLGIAAMLALVLVGALPLAAAADKEEPWFDYKAFAERLGPDEPVRFDWGHSYGDITWPRDGAEVLRVATRRPAYWKVATLEAFDGNGWIDGDDGGAPAPPDFDLPDNADGRPQWRENLRVTLRRIESYDIIAAGTTLSVDDTEHAVSWSSEPGLWESDTQLGGGDSYTARAYVPRPSVRQLTEATTSADGVRSDDLDLTIPLQTPESSPLGGDEPDELAQLRRRAEIEFPPFEPNGAAPPPAASFQTLMRSDDGDRVLRASGYAESWALARRLMRNSATPYEYVVAVNRYLSDGFRYDETPDPVSAGRPMLDGFLFETKSGYCQHYSAAMAMLLRMGGVPARVATGFSPGGYSERRQAWIVRDTDAHSWVEAWFDDIGWVAFDPTPAATPARSQIAAIERPPEESPDSGATPEGEGGSAPRIGGLRPDLAGPQSGPGGGANAAAEGGGGPAWWWFAPPLALLAGLGGWYALRRHRRSQGPAAALDRAVRELEAALRRIGRPASADTTLQQLEQRLGRTPEAAAYLRALRAGRYAPIGPPPTPRGRRALRKALASGGGPGGRLRALWALPPWRA